MKPHNQDTIIRLVEAASALVLGYVVIRMALGPDVIKQSQMRVARSISRTAKRQAEWWSGLAANADTFYHRSTL